MERRQCLARGRTAEIYEWDEGTILKLFFAWFSPEWIRLEIRAAQIVQATNLPVPKFFGTVETDGRVGLVYERIDGRTMSYEFESHPLKLFSLARLLAELHTVVHDRVVADLPSQRELLAPMIRGSPVISTQIKQRALHVLNKLPEDNVLCHHDFHTDNILMSARGPIIIDWMSAGLGNPNADVARTLLLARLSIPHDLPASWSRRLAIRIYLKRYLELRPSSAQEIATWMLPVAVARTSEGIEDEKEKLRALIQMYLANTD